MVILQNMDKILISFFNRFIHGIWVIGLNGFGLVVFVKRVRCWEENK